MTDQDFATVHLELDTAAFEKAFADFARAMGEVARAFDRASWVLCGRETPRRSAMHAAYRTKTRRRNR